jgi:hypothetical protein
MPKLATGKSQDSTLNRIEVKKYDIIFGEASILNSTMLPFFTKTLVQIAWQGRAYQARSYIMQCHKRLQLTTSSNLNHRTKAVTIVIMHHECCAEGKERAKYASHETLCRGLGKV